MDEQDNEEEGFAQTDEAEAPKSFQEKDIDEQNIARLNENIEDQKDETEQENQDEEQHATDVQKQRDGRFFRFSIGFPSSTRYYPRYYSSYFPRKYHRYYPSSSHYNYYY